MKNCQIPCSHYVHWCGMVQNDSVRKNIQLFTCSNEGGHSTRVGQSKWKMVSDQLSLLRCSLFCIIIHRLALLQALEMSLSSPPKSVDECTHIAQRAVYCTIRTVISPVLEADHDIPELFGSVRYPFTITIFSVLYQTELFRNTALV